MAEQENPYSAPTTPLTAAPGSVTAGEITDRTKDFIAKAGPWATFLGVVGFIGTGFIVLAALVMTFAAGLAAALSNSMSFLKPLSGLVGGVLGLLYLLLALIVFFPSLFLVKIGQASKKYRLRGDAADLEKYAEYVKKIFKFYGIFMIVTLSLYVLIVPIAIIAAVAASAH
jgi:hypothetical protein